MSADELLHQFCRHADSSGKAIARGVVEQVQKLVNRIMGRNVSIEEALRYLIHANTIDAYATSREVACNILIAKGGTPHDFKTPYQELAYRWWQRWGTLDGTLEGHPDKVIGGPVKTPNTVSALAETRASGGEPIPPENRTPRKKRGRKKATESHAEWKKMWESGSWESKASLARHLKKHSTTIYKELNK